MEIIRIKQKWQRNKSADMLVNRIRHRLSSTIENYQELKLHPWFY